jgi:hypothetical protein
MLLDSRRQAHYGIANRLRKDGSRQHDIKRGLSLLPEFAYSWTAVENTHRFLLIVAFELLGFPQG